MKVYISGKITGEPYDQVVEKFRKAEKHLAFFGHTPVNPLNNGIPATEPWRKHMAADLAMLLECDAIYLLTDWSQSKGARIEHSVAHGCGMEMMHQTH